MWFVPRLYESRCPFFLFYFTLEITELARNKRASQSSTYQTNDAFLAVDGVESKDAEYGSCSHTRGWPGETDPWWTVDLLCQYEISRVAIVNRENCCWERLDGFQVTVGKNGVTNVNTSDGVSSSTPCSIRVLCIMPIVPLQWTRNRE